MGNTQYETLLLDCTNLSMIIMSKSPNLRWISLFNLKDKYHYVLGRQVINPQQRHYNSKTSYSVSHFMDKGNCFSFQNLAWSISRGHQYHNRLINIFVIDWFMWNHLVHFMLKLIHLTIFLVNCRYLLVLLLSEGADTILSFPND